MGAIRRKDAGTTLYLRQPFVVGRAPGCELRLSISSVSWHHASLRWDGSCWSVVDLGSRNGTFVNGHRLPVTGRNAHVLRLQDELAFAEADETWTFVDDGPPCALLASDDATSTLPLSERELLALPNEANPLGYVYFERGVWRMEDVQGTVRELRHRDVVHVGERGFELYIPQLAEQTNSAARPIPELTLTRVWLEMLVAGNEETAGVRMRLGHDSLELPPRSHLYLLVYLARARVQARQDDPNLEPKHGGWVAVEDACRELALAADALGVMVFRCRKDFERAGFPEASRIVERDRRGYLRIGVPAARLLVVQQN